MVIEVVKNGAPDESCKTQTKQNRQYDHLVGTLIMAFHVLVSTLEVQHEGLSQEVERHQGRRKFDAVEVMHLSRSPFH
jgi:hypothetical protein